MTSETIFEAVLMVEGQPWGGPHMILTREAIEVEAKRLTSLRIKDADFKTTGDLTEFRTEEHEGLLRLIGRGALACEVVDPNIPTPSAPSFGSGPPY